MLKSFVYVIALVVGLSGCGGTSVTLSGSGEVSAVIQETGWDVDAGLIEKAVVMMKSACQSRDWVLFVRPVPMSKPSPGKADAPLILAGVEKDEASVIAETVERVFRWFPSRSVTLSGCCVHEEDINDAKKACPASKKKPILQRPNPS